MFAQMAQVLPLFDDPALDGPTNMGRDEALLQASEVSAALRLYAWSPPTISLGCFQRCELLDTLPPELRSLTVVRRQTGGGAILHDREITYCLILDESSPLAQQSPISLYRAVHECWRATLHAIGVETHLAPENWPLPTPRTGPLFCFEKPGNTDLLLGDAKLLGSAQRRTAGRVLQHGSLLLERRFAGHPGASLQIVDEPAISSLRHTFAARVAALLHLELSPATWTVELLAAADAARARYASDEWTRRR